MLGSHYHKGNSEESIGPCGVDPELFVCIFNGKIDECARRFADPVFLLQNDIGQEIDLFEPFEELIGILCDPEIPYILGFLDYLAVANIAVAALRILI